MVSVGDDVLGSLAAQHAELAAIIDPLDDADWRQPSRCEGWSVADVVLHLVQTDELALASLAGRIGEETAKLASSDAPVTSVDDAAQLAIERERGASGAELAAHWQATSAELRRALADEGPHRRVTWVAGTLSVHTLAATRLSEAWIHTGDIADAFGITPEPTDGLRHIARLAWRTLPYAFARTGRRLAGPVALALRAPSGATWEFDPDEPAVTTIRGDAAELCLVAARRREPSETSLTGDGPDVGAVLGLVRTYA